MNKKLIALILSISMATGSLPAGAHITLRAKPIVTKMVTYGCNSILLASGYLLFANSIIAGFNVMQKSDLSHLLITKSTDQRPLTQPQNSAHEAMQQLLQNTIESKKQLWKNIYSCLIVCIFAQSIKHAIAPKSINR